MSAVNWALSYRDWKAYYIKNGHSGDQDAAFVVSKIELAKGRSVQCLATSYSGGKGGYISNSETCMFNFSPTVSSATHVSFPTILDAIATYISQL